MVFIKSLSDGFAVAAQDQLIISKGAGGEQIMAIPAPVLPENLTQGQINVLNKEIRTITSVAFTKDEKYIAVTTENKQLVVFDKDSNVVRNCIINRAASKVLFTSNMDIIIADKTGDVLLYSFGADKEPVLLLGHLSVVLDVLLTDCEKFIVTCDRDEKIRVSQFPNAYNIVSFCLGHKEFVTSLKLMPNCLASASGDGTVRLWNYHTGQQLGLINSADYIQDKALLESFAKEMEEERVDVFALPITDLQVGNATQPFLLISVHSVPGLQLHSSVDPSNFKFNFITHICLTNTITSYCLSNKLFLLTDQLACFNIVDNDFVEFNSNYMREFTKKYLNCVNNTETNVTSLYKRRFDNVQEYLERKKQRLGAK